ncbi:MAG: ACP S-malonyltransferase [Deltaproteobacteria bacterium]|nr:ACP S-malonyltransferase [Deltaproteobacteria bacterium]
MKLAFIFPGQGSQYVGMGKSLYDNFKVAKETYEEANEALGLKISDLCFSGPEGDLKLTYNTQPAILTTSIAALRVLSTETPLKPLLLAGHSLGEYTALVASEVLTFCDAVRLVRARGKYMDEAVPAGTGGMAAILGMEKGKVEQLCKEASKGEVVAPANFNCPGQIVISGHAGAVTRAMELAKEWGAKAILLSVSAPSHSSLMEPAGKRLSKELEKIEVKDLKYPVISNADADFYPSKDKVTDLLIRQLSHPVRWEESVAKAVSDSTEAFIEIGPGKVLCGLLKRINKELKSFNVEDGDSLKAVQAAQLT